MKFALVNKIKTEATKGVRGICPNCGTDVIAKCGERKVKHWAHKGTQNCDPWWESETEWHRTWKNYYPSEWQEISFYDEHTNEKHIADVSTDNGIILEFQHSYIKPEEQTARENFYTNMAWVVDGSRLKRDYPRFLKAEKHNANKPNIFGVKVEDECFPSAWIERKVPVIFDFLGTEQIIDKDDGRNSLYCLFPNQLGITRIYAKFSRKAFIKATINGEWIRRSNEFIKEINKGDQAFKNQIEEIEKQRQRVFSEITSKRSKIRRTTRKHRRRL